MSFFAPQPTNSEKPNKVLRRAVPLVYLTCFACFFAYKAAGERDAASRQQTSAGLVAECKNTNRGGNYCHYTFSADNRQYIGASYAASEVEFGRTVTVYYDSKAPTINALEDFSEKSRTDENWLCIFLLLIVALIAFLFYPGAPSHEDSSGRTPWKKSA